jgi:hypothetical protein
MAGLLAVLLGLPPVDLLVCPNCGYGFAAVFIADQSARYDSRRNTLQFAHIHIHWNAVYVPTGL